LQVNISINNEVTAERVNRLRERAVPFYRLQAQEQTKESRIRRRQQNLENMNIPSTVEDLHYGPGIDDSM